MKRYKKTLVLGALVLSTILLACIERGIIGSLSTQQLASRWSKEEEYVQMACYFTEEANFDRDQIFAVEQNLVTAMEEASITGTKENGGRNWIDAYATQGNLVIGSSRGSVKARAFGVGGDFFQFHPLQLLDGNYFDATDENGDGVIIDEIVAWQLFGSNNVSGMEVEINGVVYPVRGVIRSDSGIFSEAVQEEAATIYVSYDILEGKDGSLPVDCYEVLVANPVKDFAKDSVKSALDMDEAQYELVVCSERFDLASRFEILKNFGIRSMTTKNIVFPYWENRARGYEDISALFLVLEIAFLLYPVCWFVKQLYGAWKHRKEWSKKFFGMCKTIFKNGFALLKNTIKTYKLVNKKK
ncbi:MAG: ABC transporter permease [Lachnospiraceae bacterium]|nr:ABC transporter permease [Lachnospiraceae bacterium]